MLVVGFPALAFATNCYVLAARSGEECVVVDPGVGVLERLGSTLTQYRLRPVAVLATHAHLDHVYSVTPVCQGSGGAAIPLYLHGADAYRLRDPLSLMDPNVVELLEQQFGARSHWTEPSDVRALRDGERLSLAGLSLRAVHAPGHTEGSVMFSLPGSDQEAPAAEPEVPDVCLSGDVIFAGSIGRTDLPGGDQQAMLRTLRDKVMPLADSTVILPGHGANTTMARERASNPFLRAL